MNFRISRPEAKLVVRPEWYPRLPEDRLYLPCLMRLKNNLTLEELKVAACMMSRMETTIATVTATVMGMATVTATVTVMVTARRGLYIMSTGIYYDDLIPLPNNLGVAHPDIEVAKDIRNTTLFWHCDIGGLLKYMEFKEV